MRDSPGRHDGEPLPGSDTAPKEGEQISEPQVERIDALFVQSATAFTSAPGTITLHGLADSTVYFADRPRREVGHMPSHKFVELWESGANTFAVDPPNAVLSFLDVEGESPADAVVVLRKPRLEDTTLTYSVDVLDGTLPARHGPCTLFIDVFGRPLRRQRRRLARFIHALPKDASVPKPVPEASVLFIYTYARRSLRVVESMAVGRAEAQGKWVADSSPQ
jgi:hypothetical protein